MALKRPLRENKKGLRGTKLEVAAHRKMQNGWQIPDSIHWRFVASFNVFYILMKKHKVEH